MSRYQTEQKRILVSYLKEHHNKQYTIDELVAQMTAEKMRRAADGGEDGEKIPGKSTVYRLMNLLVEEGVVRRFVKGQSRQFLYQAVEGEQCQYHFHLKCVACGKMIHLGDAFSSQIEENIKKQFGFLVDEGQTMMFGKCVSCAGR